MVLKVAGTGPEYKKDAGRDTGKKWVSEPSLMTQQRKRAKVG